jgi:hypothetical protein
LIVDEAQNLTPRAVEELRMLSNFQLGGKALLQSFLIGQPELRRTLQGRDMQQFRQRVIASYHLGPLDQDETEAYIKHRLGQVGWARDPRLEQGAYDAIFAFTSGIPRRVNLVCNRLLIAGFLNEKHVLDAADVEMVAGELKEELGMVGRPEAVAEEVAEESMKPRAPGIASAMPATDRGEPPRLKEDLVYSAPSSSQSPSEPIDLQGRVLRLEKTLAHVLGMLRRVVRVIEPLEQ